MIRKRKPSHPNPKALAIVYARIRWFLAKRELEQRASPKRSKSRSRVSAA
jgi:hypothetical protein